MDRLEDRTTPSISFSSLVAAPDPLSENGTVTLTGTLVGASIGDMNVTVNWNDLSPLDSFVVPAGSATFTRTHVYLDDNPTGTSSDLTNITASVVDTGASVITGPNTFGYRAYSDSYWNLNLAPGGTGVTTLLGSNLDDTTAAIDLGADVFRFYSTNYSGAASLFASTNGLLTFTTANSAAANTALSSGPTQAAIAAFWDDLRTGPTGSVLTRKVDVDSNGVNDFLIVEWNDVQRVGFTTPLGTFQAILQLNTGTNAGDIVLNYVATTFGDVSVDYGASATVGVKNSGTFDPAQVTFDAATNHVRDRNAVRFSAQNITTTPLLPVNPFGYRMLKTPFQAPGNPVDLIAGNSGVTQIHGGSIDDSSVTFNLGTNIFRFYGTNYTGNNQLFVSSNGLITFGSGDATFTNSDLTTTSQTRAAIAPFWDDLHTGGGAGRVLAKFVDMDGDTVNDWLIIEWSQIRLFGGADADNGTFQAILQLNSGLAQGDIIFNYVDTDFNNTGANSGASASIGIKNANTPGPANPLQLTFNAANTNVAGGNATRIVRTNVSSTAFLTVNNVAPTIVSLTPSGSVINEGEMLTLNGTISDPGTLDPHTVAINWNDGSANSTVTLAAGVTTFAVSHTYADDNPTGTSTDLVTIQVNVSDDDLGSASQSLNVTVANVAPVAVINGAPTTSPEGTAISLTSGVTDAGVGDTFTYSWAVTKNGNPYSTAVTQNFSFTPDDNGTYVVTLTVFDDDGGFSVAPSKTITVTNVNPAPTITGVGATSPEGTMISLTASTNDPGTADTFTFIWTLTRDGNPFTDFTGQGTANISFTPDDNSVFVINVTVTDDDLGSGATSKTVTILNVNPTATFANDGPKPQFSVINFSFTSQFDPSTVDTTAGFTYSYDFDNNGVYTDPGDILNSPLSSASKFYAPFGTYIVRGKVTDKDGGETEYSTTVTIDKQGNGGIVDTHLTVVGADSGGGPHVRGFSPDGSERFSFFAYGEAFAGGVRVATGDVTGDGVEDIITGAGPGGGPHVKVFDGSTGAEVRSFFAFAADFAGGVNLASRDVNRDNWDDMIIGAGVGGGSRVVVISGRDQSVLMDFNAYAPSFGGEVVVGSADFDGDSFADIITGAGAGGGPHVRVLSGATGAELRSFFAFDPAFSVGVNVAGGDMTGDGVADIIVGSGAEPGTDSRVRVFNGADQSLIWEFVAYPAYRGGVRVGSEDLNLDGVADILLAPGKGTGSNILGLDGRDLKQLRNFFAYDPGFLGGVFVG